LKLSIIIPVFNEINFLENFCKNLFYSFKDEDVEYIFVNDGSTDGSGQWIEEKVKKIKNKNIKTINIDKNKGKGFALRKGIKLAQGDYMLFQDSDLELNTDDSFEMFKIISEDNTIDVLFGTRFSSGKLKKNENLINELFGRLNSLIFNIFFGQSISDVHCGTKIISKQVMEKIDLSINDFGFELDIATQIAKNKFQIYEYGVSYIARSKNEGKKITWIDGIKSHYYMFKIRFIDNDLSTLISIIFSSFYMSYIGSYFGLGTGKIILIFLFCIIGGFIGLKRKLFPSSLILIFCYFGSFFSKGNGKILTVFLGFLIGIYISNKIINLIKNKSSNKFINFFV